MIFIAGGGDPKEFELVLTKSPMAGSTTEQKSEQAKQEEPVTPTAPGSEGFEHIANIPTIFCAPREIAKGLLVDLIALVSTLNAMETGSVNAETLPIVLQNAQKILLNLSDVMIRDCGVTEQDLKEVTNVFKEVNEEASRQVTQPQPVKQPVSAPVAPPAVPVTEPPKEQKTRTNIL